MRTETLRRFTSVHTWTGLIAGWALFIAFFAGSIIVFYHELHEWAAHETRDIPADDALRVEQLIKAVVAQQPAAATELQISVHQSPRAIAYWRNANSEDYSMGELVGDELVTPDPRRFSLPDFIYRIHYSLGLPETFGMYLLGLICVIYGLALVSGVVIHAPHLFADLFALRIGRNLKRLWQDSHNVIGVFSLPFHIVFAYTGAMFTILVLLVSGMSYFALKGRAEPLLSQATQVVAPREASGDEAVMLDVASLISSAKRAEPNFHPTFLSFRHYGDRNSTVEMYGELPGRFIKHGRIVIETATGAVIGRAIGSEGRAGILATGVMFALHFGSFGGATIQWMYFLLGLAGAFLFYSGNLLWIESRRRRRERAQLRSHIVMAQLTSGICIGSCLAIAGLFVANKLPPLDVVPAENWDQVIYSVLFLASVGYALSRAPARGATHLLSMTAAIAISIPFINWFVTGDHIVRTAAAQQWSTFGVDMTALAMGIGFAALAFAVRRRAQRGDLNSVWSRDPQAVPSAKSMSEASLNSINQEEGRN